MKIYKCEMVKQKRTLVAMALIFLLICPTLLSCEKEEVKLDPEKPNDSKEMTIKEKAAFRIGAAVTLEDLNIATYADTLVHHYNRITAEYEMKMTPIWGSADNYNWDKVDGLVDFAQEHGMEVHGHTLLWYREFPGWFKSADYDSAAFESLIKEYITTVVSRYKGKVQSWDVANEIFNDNGTLRVDEFVFKTFSDPIGFYGRCFQYARDADLDALLFYNDYSVVLASGKRFAITEMVSRFQNEGYPIDGIGGQFHFGLNTTESTIESGLMDIARTGLLFHISELDIKVNVNQSNSYVFTPGEQNRQAEKYKAIVEMYERVLSQDQKFGITTWGLTDKYTWLTGYWHEKEYPLLFDESYNRKKAYTGFLDGLNEVE